MMVMLIREFKGLAILKVDGKSSKVFRTGKSPWPWIGKVFLSTPTVTSLFR